MICYINRGCPGSGKSYRARYLAAHHMALGEAVYIFASDDYFVQNAAGEYRWSGERLYRAHLWNYARFRRAVDSKAAVIIVDNVNATIREAKPFVEYALKAGYEIEFLEPVTPWAFDAKELVARNSHSVPLQGIERMLRRWVKNMTVEKVMAHSCRNKLADADASPDEKALIEVDDARDLTVGATA